MRWLFIVALAAVASTMVRAEETPRVFKFSKSELGKVPAGWKAEQTGDGKGSVWKVTADKTAPSGTAYVLTQTAKSPSRVFNLCIAQQAKFKDPNLSVSFKALAGESDQGGGLVWRFRDANNYYVARMNPLEDNYRIYKVVAGKRVELGRKEGVHIKPGEWHKLDVKVNGKDMEGYLDGVKMWQITDDTFDSAGMIGLWTKADAQTSFDGLEVDERVKSP